MYSKRIYLDRSDVEGFVSTIPTGEIFGVEFVKKDGTVRTMSARMGVHKGVRGTDTTDRATWIKEHGLLTVFDMNKVDEAFNQRLVEDGEDVTRGAWRMIPTTRVRKLTHGQRVLAVVD